MLEKILEVVTVELVTLVSLTNDENVRTRSRLGSGEFCYDASHGMIINVYINFTDLKKQSTEKVSHCLLQCNLKIESPHFGRVTTYYSKTLFRLSTAKTVGKVHKANGSN